MAVKSKNTEVGTRTKDGRGYTHFLVCLREFDLFLSERIHFYHLVRYLFPDILTIIYETRGRNYMGKR